MKHTAAIILTAFLFVGCASRPEGYDQKTNVYRTLTPAEAKKAGFNFWQRNAYLPWIYPFAVIDSLNQIRG